VFVKWYGSNSLFTSQINVTLCFAKIKKKKKNKKREKNKKKLKKRGEIMKNK